MYEISSAVVTLWTLGTFIFASGFGWAGIKYGQRTNEASVREVRRDVEKIQDCVKALKERLGKDELTYMTRSDCHEEQDDCDKHRTYHENQLLSKLEELKTMMIAMDNKREATRLELSDALNTLASDLRTENDRRFGNYAVT